MRFSKKHLIIVTMCLVHSCKHLTHILWKILKTELFSGENVESDIFSSSAVAAN